MKTGVCSLSNRVRVCDVRPWCFPIARPANHDQTDSRNPLPPFRANSTPTHAHLVRLDVAIHARRDADAHVEVLPRVPVEEAKLGVQVALAVCGWCETAVT